MLTRSDLHDLATAQPETAVSLYLPTHVTGREVRQDPIRLKNLLAEARAGLADRGVADPEAMLESATALLDDGAFWAERSAGLAVFIDSGSTRHYALPSAVDERVVVGSGFRVRPLLPMLSADRSFAVLAVTEREAALRLGSRYALGDESVVELPEHPLRSGVESDYENPVNASPPNRPNVGGQNIGNAQVYGDSPPEFRKTQLLTYAGALAKTVEAWLVSNPMPLVIVADAELGGHLQQSAGLRSRLTGVVDANPAALGSEALHDAAYERVAQSFGAELDDALDEAHRLVGRRDERVLTGSRQIVDAAEMGRVATLIIAGEGQARRTPSSEAPSSEAQSSEAPSDQALSDESSSRETPSPESDLVEAAIRGTVLGGGEVHVAEASRLPNDAEIVALLRY